MLGLRLGLRLGLGKGFSNSHRVIVVQENSEAKDTQRQPKKDVEKKGVAMNEGGLGLELGFGLGYKESRVRVRVRWGEGGTK